MLYSRLANRILTFALEMQDASSTHPSVPAATSNTASTAPAPAKKTKPTLEPRVGRYLEGIIDPEFIRMYQDHVVRYRQTHKAYAIVTMARLIEAACGEVNINYETGNARSHKNLTHNGPDVALDDVVLFFGDQTPSHLKKIKGFSTAPSTFANHRSWYLRAKKCLVDLEGGSVPEGKPKASLGSVQKLLNTQLTDLGELEPREYGSWENFTDRVRLLESTAKGTSTSA